MKLNFWLVLAVCCCLLPWAWSQPQNAFSANYDLSESRAEALLAEINQVYLESAPAYRKFADDEMSPQIIMREKLRPYYQELSSLPWHTYSNPLLRRQIEVILRGAKYPPIDHTFKMATHALKSVGKIKHVCDPVEARSVDPKCNLGYLQNIKAILRNSEDLDEIVWYWKEWRNRMPNEVRNALHYYIDYYRNISTPEMPPSALWYDQYEDAHFLTELEELMEMIQPFYREMHAHLKKALRQKYGNHIIPSSELIPHHLLEQTLYQAWKKESVLLNPFPERKLPNVQHELHENAWAPLDLVNISALYFGSLGFENLTNDFMRDHFIKLRHGEGGVDCKSHIFTYGEIELHYCPKVNYKKLLQTHGDMAHIEYAILKNKLPVGLNQEACPGFSNALGEATILSVSTPKHLQNHLGLLQNYDYDDVLNLNRLYRMAIHTVFSVPIYFVHEKLWVDMIDGKVRPEDYNCHYWNLMEKYMGVGPSAATNAYGYDMPYKFYEGIIDQYSSTRKLFGEFLGYQIYRSICLETGEFVRGNAYKNLHNCAFTNNKHAGELLKNMMSAGSTKSWREIIKPLTKRQLTKLAGMAFLEYFEPLNTWITEDNVENKLNVGWTHNQACPRINAV